MTTIRPKPLDQVDQVILGHVIDVLRGAGRARPTLAIAEDVARRMGGELPPAARLYPNHPNRIAVAECVLALHGAGELVPLMAQQSLGQGGNGTWHGDKQLTAPTPT